ncbi:hypothetical protein V8E36_006759 [Tilletia maclaganii]
MSPSAPFERLVCHVTAIATVGSGVIDHTRVCAVGDATVVAVAAKLGVIARLARAVRSPVAGHAAVELDPVGGCFPDQVRVSLAVAVGLVIAVLALICVIGVDVCCSQERGKDGELVQLHLAERVRVCDAVNGKAGCRERIAEEGGDRVQMQSLGLFKGRYANGLTPSQPSGGMSLYWLAELTSIQGLCIYCSRTSTKAKE